MRREARPLGGVARGENAKGVTVCGMMKVTKPKHQSRRKDAVRHYTTQHVPGTHLDFKRRAAPRRVFRGPTGRATRRFSSAVSGGSERRAPGSPRGWPVGGRPRKTSERTAARSAPFVRTDCRAETQIRPKPHFTQAVKTSPRPNPANKG